MFTMCLVLEVFTRIYLCNWINISFRRLEKTGEIVTGHYTSQMRLYLLSIVSFLTFGWSRPIFFFFDKKWLWVIARTVRLFCCKLHGLVKLATFKEKSYYEMHLKRHFSASLGVLRSNRWLSHWQLAPIS